MENKKIRVEVAYALPEAQTVLAVSVDPGSCIEAAVLASGIMQQYPEIDLYAAKVGIFGKIQQLSDLVHEGDRIEIYRPLRIDPKEARRARAKASPIAALDGLQTSLGKD
jgi:putative ubiquitin-RnfH superfamily antitoxin RatB of RatAB toxin-antitoxin module